MNDDEHDRQPNSSSAAPSQNSVPAVTPTVNGPASTPARTIYFTAHWTTWALIGLVFLASVFAMIYWQLVARFEESTEDAYVEGNAVMVTSQISGVVTGILADTTDKVDVGEVVIRLNPVDSQLALERAEANLARTVRQVRSQFANATQMRANVVVRETELSKTKADLDRRDQLVAGGAISGEEANHARDAFKAAVAALDASRSAYASNQALVDSTTLSNHPDVRAAATQLRDAYVARERNDLPATVSGIVTRRNVQVGQRVSAGTPLISIVPTDELWVSANFTESQLGAIRVGQQATLTSDAYGRSVRYVGHVIGIDAGTGSAFSILPAQNATGNWVKTVQRVPVRISLDKEQLAKYPLRIGLSMHATVDITSRAGGKLSVNSVTRQPYETRVFSDELKSADDLVMNTISENAGTAETKGGRN